MTTNSTTTTNTTPATQPTGGLAGAKGNTLTGDSGDMHNTDPTVTQATVAKPNAQ